MGLSYNAKGNRVYSDHRWPCCSGTLPQLAADYGINTYLRDFHAIWINLYIPSVLRFVENGVSFSLEQSGEYPYSDKVTFKITTSRKADITLRFRIPAWIRNPQIEVNGRPFPLAVTKGFASVHRTWKTGDFVNLLLPATLRLEPISAAYPDTAALLYGPLVLFALTSAPPIRDANTSSRREEGYCYGMVHSYRRVSVAPSPVHRHRRRDLRDLSNLCGRGQARRRLSWDHLRCRPELLTSTINTGVEAKGVDYVPALIFTSGNTHHPAAP
jgi:hypothetical protein